MLPFREKGVRFPYFCRNNNNSIKTVRFHFLPERMWKESYAILYVSKDHFHTQADFFMVLVYGGFTGKRPGKILRSGNNAVHALDGAIYVKKESLLQLSAHPDPENPRCCICWAGWTPWPSGTVMVDGQDIFSLKEEALTIFRRRKIGFVFQSYNLVPVLNVYENIILPTELDGGKVNKAFVQQIVQTLGLNDRLDALPNQLSGGQQQRVAIARALAAASAIILADEPTGNLDSKTSQDVLSLLKVSSQKFAQTIVMITHNEEIAQMADRIIRIEDGRIVSQN